MYRKNALNLFFILLTIIATTGSLLCYPESYQYACCNQISLEQMVDVAFQNRDDLKAFDYLIKANQFGEKAAIGGYLPQVRVSFHTGKASKAETRDVAIPVQFDLPSEITGLVPGEVSPISFEIPTVAGATTGFFFPKERITFDVSQLILSLNGPMLQRKIAQQETFISTTQQQQLENLIRFNTESAFLELKKLLLQNMEIKALKESSEITFDQSKWRNEVGFLNRSQWDFSKSTFSQEQTDVVNYPNDIQQAISKLEREANSTVDPTHIMLSLENIQNIVLESLQYYQEKAIENRPDLHEQFYRIKQAKYSERFHKNSYVPEVSFFANITKSKYSECNKPLFWNLGIRVDWALDGFANANLASKYERTRTEFILRKRDLELQILQEIRELYFLLKTLFHQLEPAQAAFKQSLTELDNQKRQYQVGLAALFEYEQAKLNARKSEFTLMSLKIDIKNNYQRLLFLCGYPPEIV